MTDKNNFFYKTPGNLPSEGGKITTPPWRSVLENALSFTTLAPPPPPPHKKDYRAIILVVELLRPFLSEVPKQRPNLPQPFY